MSFSLQRIFGGLPLRQPAPAQAAAAPTGSHRAQADQADVFETQRAGSTAGATSTQRGFSPSAEKADLTKVNRRRRNKGLRPLRRDADLSKMARDWAKRMANDNTLKHRPNLGASADRYSDKRWKSVGENVGYGGSEASIYKMWIESPGHRRNIDNRNFDSIGIGAYKDGNGRVWMCQVFADFA